LSPGTRAAIVYAMQGVIEVRPENMETLSSGGLDLSYIEYGEVQPAIKLIYAGEEYWYYKTLPLKGYGAVLAGYIRDLEAQGHKPILARFFNRIYIYATGITPIGAGKPPGAG
jgi:hypothetical protein